MGITYFRRFPLKLLANKSNFVINENNKRNFKVSPKNQAKNTSFKNLI